MSAVLQRRRAASLIGIGALACTLAHGDGTPPPPSPPAVSKVIATGDGSTITVEAGELQVPESRQRHTGHVVSIPYYRLRAATPNPATPVFLLAGGPGVPALEEFEEDPDERALALFFTGVADVVVFDQRGAGRSRPRLDCPQRVNLPLGLPLTSGAFAAEVRRKSVECRDAFRGEGVDLAAFNTVENAADVDALRAALGYERISLVGGSYGSHLAFALLRFHPQRIERAVLYGIEGPDQTYDLPSQTLADLARIAEAADRAPDLRAFVPAGGSMAAFESVLQQLERKPVEVTVTRDGQPVTIVLGRYDLERTARRGTADRRDISWPANVIAMHRGDFTQAAQAALESRSEPIDSAMYFMMDCASGISPARRNRLLAHPAEDRARAIIGELNLDYLAACDLWDSPDLGDDFRSDLRTATPVLAFQGTWDISTPYENAAEATRGFENLQLVTVEGGTHWTLGDLLDSPSSAAVQLLLQDFLRGRAVDAPARIELPPAGFRVPKTSAREP